jgi:hypothetical protein
MSKAPDSFSFIDRAIGSALDESQGRYAKSVPTFPGANTYPRQSEDSPWSHGQLVPPEPPYPVDINYVPPVGEFHERELASPSSSPFSEGGAPLGSVELDVASFHQEPVPKGFVHEEIDDGCPGPRRPDGTPLSTSLPKRRRA